MIENRKIQIGAFIFFIVIFLVSLNSIITYGNRVDEEVEKPSKVVDQPQVVTPTSTDIEENPTVTTESSSEVLPKPDESVKEDVPADVVEKEFTFFFLPDQAVLMENYQEAFDEIIEILQMYPSTKIRVEGHYNGYPDQYDTQNGKRLSYERALVITNIFKEADVSSIRLRIVNVGSDSQVNIDESAEELKKNRRVYIQFIVD